MNKQRIAQNLKIEEKILNELQKNCRLNIDEIGKKCGCSRYIVRRYMKKLEENNTILGYSAIVNPKKINLKHYILLIKRTNIPLDEEILKNLPVVTIADFIPEMDVNINLEDTRYLHGNYDWVTTFTTEDITNAKEYCNQILKIYHKYVESVELLETVRPIRINGFKISQPEHLPDIF
jgi:DNA-binding Lrp family transcriptional regulator